MSSNFLSPWKRITIPFYGPTNTTQVMPIIDTARFHQLRWRSQNQLSHFVFPGATHNRFEHSIAVFAQCTQYANPLLKKGMITAEQALNVRIAALLHDLGHAPFSHLLEKVLSIYGTQFKNHNERTIFLIKELKEQIESCGGNLAEVLKIVNKEHELSALISDPTLGADKIAYSCVDQHHAGYPLSKLDIGDLPDNLMFINGKFGADGRTSHNLIQIQRHFFTMYAELYLRKQTRTLDRILERAVQLALEENALDANKVWAMPEYELTSWLTSTPGPWQKSMKRLFEGPRDVLKAAVILRRPGTEQMEITSGKPIQIFSIRTDLSDDFYKFYNDPRNLLVVEKQIAKVLNIDLDDVAFICVADPKRLVPKDVTLFGPTGTPTKSLFSRYPEHKKSLQELAFHVTACRVMVSAQYRKLACGAATHIIKLIEDAVPSNT